MIHEPSSAAPKKEYVFNEAQEAWLKALESGEYEQCTHDLHDGKGFCCLGVACVVAGMSADEIHDYQNKVEAVAPHSVVSSLRLRGERGQVDGTIYIRHMRSVTLTSANDCGATFSEIAAFIRSSPTAVFVE